MEKSYTISEIADYFNISAQTLRYYDRIGLLKPEKVSESSGYRLYEMRQIGILYLIRELKQLGLSLNQIKSYCQTKDIGELKRSLEETLADLNRQIDSLQQIQRHTEDYLRRIQLLENARNKDAIELRPVPERYAYVLEINYTIDRLQDYVAMMQESYAHSPLRSAEPGRVVLGIRQQELERKNVHIYHSIGHMLDRPVADSKVRTYPAGLFAIACHLGGYDTIASTYKKLLAYIDESGYRIAGDSLEISVVDIAYTENPDEFVTEVQIPVTKDSGI